MITISFSATDWYLSGSAFTRASASRSTSAARLVHRRPALGVEVGLQEQSSGHGVDVFLPSPRLPTHLAYRSEHACCRHPLVPHSDLQVPHAPLDIIGEGSCGVSGITFRSRFIQREPHDDTHNIVFLDLFE